MKIIPNAFLVGLFDKNCIVTHNNFKVGFDASEREYCKKTKLIPKNEPYISNSFVGNTSYRNVTHTYQFKIDDSNEFVGFAAFGIQLNFFDKWINKINTSQHSIIYILDNQLHLLANKSEQELINGEKIENNILKEFVKSKKTNITYVEKLSFNNAYTFNAQKVDDLPFIVIVGESSKGWLNQWYRELFLTISIFIFSSTLLYLLFKNYEKLLNQKKELEKISITDALTHIYNRRYFNEIFPKVINSAKRDNDLVSFLIMDIDHFKQYNDTYGHQMGDDVLVKVATAIKDSLHRGDDICFRLGGEEFGVILKADSKDKALEFANRIKENIERLHIEHCGNSASKYITASMGLICKNANDITSDDEVYKEADDLLYKAKDGGRNRVEN